MKKCRVLKKCLYYDMVFDVVKVEDYIITLDTFDGEKHFTLDEVEEVKKRDFCVLNNRTNKVITIIKAYDRQEVSKQFKGRKNIKIITKGKYQKEQQLIKEDKKRREQLLKKGVLIRALDIPKK